MAKYGPELVTDGVFSVPASWTTTGSASVTGGVLNSSAGAGTASQAISISAGKSYYVSYTITANTDAVYPILGGTSGTVRTSPTTGAIAETIVAGSSNSNIVMSLEFASIDTLSIKEISIAAVIETALYDLLRLDTTVSGIVSDRIEPQIIPQGTAYPAIRLNHISSVREHNLVDTVEMVPARFQIDCYGSTHAGARTLADAVRGALDNYRGTVGTVVIQATHLIDEGDYFSEQVGVDQLRRYGKRQDYTIWYNE